MTPSPLARRYVWWMAFVLAILATPVFGDEPDPKPAPNPARLVTAGDTVTVTLWSGGRVSGHVVDTTNCSLVLRTGDRTWPLQWPAIKTLRRHEVRTNNAGTQVMLEIAEQCDQIECLPAAFAFFGIGAAIQGFDHLAHPPRVVYRAKQRLPAAAPCGRDGLDVAPPR